MQQLRFLCFARCLMLIDIYMKFREDSLNGFFKFKSGEDFVKENNSKSINARIMILALCTSSNFD